MAENLMKLTLQLKIRRKRILCTNPNLIMEKKQDIIWIWVPAIRVQRRFWEAKEDLLQLSFFK